MTVIEIKEIIIAVTSAIVTIIGALAGLHFHKRRKSKKSKDKNNEGYCG